eukprot:1485433-Prymnesium_polylepis.2
MAARRTTAAESHVACTCALPLPIKNRPHPSVAFHLVVEDDGCVAHVKAPIIVVVSPAVELNGGDPRCFSRHEVAQRVPHPHILECHIAPLAVDFCKVESCALQIGPCGGCSHKRPRQVR